MKFTFAHNNINVLNLERSLEFYRAALGPRTGVSSWFSWGTGRPLTGSS